MSGSGRGLTALCSDIGPSCVVCSMDASLEELRKKIMDAAKCALPKSKVAYSNVIATRYKLSRYQTAMGSEGLY